MKINEAQTAYLAYLTAAGHKVAFMTADSDFVELYVVTYGHGAAFYTHTLIDEGREPVSVDYHDSMASAVAFCVNQAVHTYVHSCELAAPFYENHNNKPRSADEAALGHAIGQQMLTRNAPRDTIVPIDVAIARQA